jgi:hypothetical protein
MALLIPSYSNYTTSGWNVRINAFTYQLPNVTNDTLSGLTDALGLADSFFNSTEQVAFRRHCHRLLTRDRLYCTTEPWS